MQMPRLIQIGLSIEGEVDLVFPACLFSESFAFVIVDEHLEVHEVKPTDDPNKFETVKASDAIFYVGEDHSTVLEDMVNLSLLGFARKYGPSDFYETEQARSSI